MDADEIIESGLEFEEGEWDEEYAGAIPEEERGFEML